MRCIPFTLPHGNEPAALSIIHGRAEVFVTLHRTKVADVGAVDCRQLSVALYKLAFKLGHTIASLPPGVYDTPGSFTRFLASPAGWTKAMEPAPSGIPWNLPAP